MSGELYRSNNYLTAKTTLTDIVFFSSQTRIFSLHLTLEISVKSWSWYFLGCSPNLSVWQPNYSGAFGVVTVLVFKASEDQQGLLLQTECSCWMLHLLCGRG